MCLKNNQKILNQILAEENDIIICYKLLVERPYYWNNRISRITYLYSPFFHTEYKPGYTKAIFGSLFNIEFSRKCPVIYTGIHVFRSEIGAKRSKLYKEAYGQRLVKVKCLKKDLIGANRFEMVFTKVFLSKANYNKRMEP